jgi:hypothetical protein
MPTETQPPAGILEVGNDGREVVVNHPDLKPDKDGVGHITFSPAQARHFAGLLLKHADELQPPEEKAPLHAFEISIAIGGNTLEYVDRALADIRTHLASNRGGMMSGGGGGCHSLTVRTRDIAPEAYDRELLEWSDRQRGRR